MAVIMLGSVDAFADWGRLEGAGAARLHRKSQTHPLARIGVRSRRATSPEAWLTAKPLDPVAHGKPTTATAHLQVINDTMRPAKASLMRGHVPGSVESAAE